MDVAFINRDTDYWVRVGLQSRFPLSRAANTHQWGGAVVYDFINESGSGEFHWLSS